MKQIEVKKGRWVESSLGMRYKIVYVYPWKTNCVIEQKIEGAKTRKFILSQGQYRLFKIIGEAKNVTRHYQIS